GAHAVAVTDASSNSASANFTVNPKITLSPTTGNAGSTDTITGTGFGGSKSITATFNGSSATLGGTTTTDANGGFSGATYTVPNIGSGTYAVAVTDAASNTASANYSIQGSVTSRQTGNWD